MTDPRERPSMSELAAVSVPECSYCGCRDFRVQSTWRVKSGAVHRQRVCRHCGRGILYTSETVRTNSH